MAQKSQDLPMGRFQWIQMKDIPNARGKQTINAIASESQMGEIAQRVYRDI